MHQCEGYRPLIQPGIGQVCTEGVPKPMAPRHFQRLMRARRNREAFHPLDAPKPSTDCSTPHMKNRLRRVFEGFLVGAIEQNRGICPLPQFCATSQLPTKERYILNGGVPVGAAWIRLPELRQNQPLVCLHGVEEVLIQTERFGLFSPARLVVFLFCPINPDLAALVSFREITKNHHAHLSTTLSVNHQNAQVQVLLRI